MTFTAWKQSERCNRGAAAHKELFSSTAEQMKNLILVIIALLAFRLNTHNFLLKCSLFWLGQFQNSGYKVWITFANIKKKHPATAAVACLWKWLVNVLGLLGHLDGRVLTWWIFCMRTSHRHRRTYHRELSLLSFSLFSLLLLYFIMIHICQHC